jgi:hypothetical protein
MVPSVGELCVLVVSGLTTPGFLDGHFGFCLMYLFSSPLSVFDLVLYAYFLVIFMA